MFCCGSVFRDKGWVGGWGASRWGEEGSRVEVEKKKREKETAAQLTHTLQTARSSFPRFGSLRRSLFLCSRSSSPSDGVVVRRELSAGEKNSARRHSEGEEREKRWIGDIGWSNFSNFEWFRSHLSRAQAASSLYLRIHPSQSGARARLGCSRLAPLVRRERERARESESQPSLRSHLALLLSLTSSRLLSRRACLPSLCKKYQRLLSLSLLSSLTPLSRLSPPCSSRPISYSIKTNK